MSDQSLRQFGWYLRNVVLSNIRPELDKLVHSMLTEEGGLAATARSRRNGPTEAPVPPKADAAVLDRPALLRSLSAFTHAPDGVEPFEQNARWAAEELELDATDLEILLLVLRQRKRGKLANFFKQVLEYVNDTPQAVAALVGVEPHLAAERLAPTAPLLVCGLLEFGAAKRWDPDESLYLSGVASYRMLTPYADRAAWVAAMVGTLCVPGLAWEEFAHLGEMASIAARVLQQAAACGEAGVHVMLVGPPGTGKTEFARALAARTGLVLYAVGEDGEAGEPSREERSAALRLAYALLRNRRDAALLLDEAEDVLESARSFGVNRSSVSKVFLNRTLEAATVPTIWTSNNLAHMDAAVLRRMTLVLRLDVPDTPVRERIWQRVLDCECLIVGDGTAARLAKRWPASAGVAAGAARATRLIGGGEAELEAVIAGVARAVGSPPVRTATSAVAFDPELTACREDLDRLCQRLARPGAPRGWSLCISGPPGTGKSEFARHLATRLGLPVLQKRASDLLSMFVGGTEQAIAAAFAEAAEKQAMLLMDEAEALLFDRTAAHRAFEVSQVNEMLTWMEGHALPFVCTTNLPERMDAAVPRRFTLKLRFEALDQQRAALAFRRILGAVPPGELPEGLTPGDFATVRHKAELLEEACPAVLLDWLAEEREARQGTRSPVGFRVERSVSEPVSLEQAAVAPQVAGTGHSFVERPARSSSTGAR